jgi:hypothetical protein
MGAGAFLTCGRMAVDLEDGCVRATVRSGAAIAASADGTDWRLDVPRASTTGEAVPEDIEDLTGLALVTGWRACGMVPVHAGSVVRGGATAILAATSGGGKTTLTASLIRRGWRTLGDDKLLLDLDEAGRPRLAALIHSFNLHPHARRWFPEVGDLSRLPRYSAWTEKRKVRIADVWPGAALDRARPTHLLRITREPRAVGVSTRPMAAAEILPTLLRQTVVPRHPAAARPIVAMLAATAGGLVGLDVTIGADVYDDPAALEPLEAALA